MPSGASKGKTEAVEVLDKDQSRLNGRGVLTAIKNINTTKKSALCGVDATDQNAIDKKLIEIDSTPNKSLIVFTKKKNRSGISFVNDKSFKSATKLLQYGLTCIFNICCQITIFL